MNSKNLEVKHYIGLEQSSYAHSVSFNPRNHLLAVGTEQDGLVIYDLDPRKLVRKIPIDYRVHVVQWSHDGEFLAAGGISGDIIIWNVADWSKHVTLPNSDGALNFSWSSDGKFLAVGSWHSSSEKHAEIWSTTSWERVATRNKTMPRFVSFSSNSKYLAIQYKLEGIEILSVPDFKRVTLLDFSDSKENTDISSPCWSNDGRFIAASCGDGRIRVWLTTDWSLVTTKQLHDYWDEGVYRLCFSPNSKHLLSGGFGEPKLLSVAEWKVIYTFDIGSVADLFDCSWSFDSKLLALLLRGGKEVGIWSFLE